MIYLIGGSPRSGKSTLAKEISKKQSIQLLSTDFFRLMLLPYFTGKEREENFPFEMMYEKAGIQQLYEIYSDIDLLSADIHESGVLWTGIKSFLDFLISSKQDYIIEGIHLIPHLLSEYKNNHDIRIIYLGKLDKSKIYDGLLENKGNNDWIADNIDDNGLVKVAESLSTYGKFFQEEVIKYGFDMYNTEDNFIEMIDSIIQIFIKK